jgi:hypothetical protein
LTRATTSTPKRRPGRLWRQSKASTTPRGSWALRRWGDAFKTMATAYSYPGLKEQWFMSA